jgi:hypothetical protein
MLQLFVLAMCLLGWFVTPPAGSRRLWLLLAGAFVCAEALLIRYHLTAWGNVLGPLNGHSVVLTLDQTRYIAGLLFDQNQGVFAQHPFLLIGMYGIGALFRVSRRLALLTAVCVGMPLVANGLHWNIYGGYSYSGRFMSTSAVVLLIPTIYGIVHMQRVAPTVLRACLGLSVAVQLWFVYWVTTQIAINQRPVTRLDLPVAEYSLWYGPIAEAMGMFVAGANPWLHAANYMWVALALGVFGLGVFHVREQSPQTEPTEVTVP